MFTVYPFVNGKSLVTWNDSEGTLQRALVAQNYSALPPLLTLAGSQTTPYLTLLLGNLAWEPIYETLDPALLTAPQQATLARLTSRYAEVLAAASAGGAGSGVVLDSPRHFFRLRRIAADQDGDFLSWFTELMLGTDPANPDSDLDGIPDGEEIAAGTSPISADTDGDGFMDGTETGNHSDPLSPASVPAVFRVAHRLLYYTFPPELEGEIEELCTWSDAHPIRTVPSPVSLGSLSFTLAFPDLPPAGAFLTDAPSATAETPVWWYEFDALLAQDRAWLVRDFPASMAVERQVLAVTRRFYRERHVLVWEEAPPALRILTFTIPAGATVSTPVDMEAHLLPIGDGYEVHETVQENLLPVEMKEVSFDGAKYWELKSDKAVPPSTDVVTYTAPHWRDTNGDGRATTNFDDLANGERNFPVAFTRNTKPKVKGKLKISGLPTGMSVSVRATSPQGRQFPEKTATVSADGIVEMTEFSESTTPWQNDIRFWSATGSETYTTTGDNAFCLDWEINVGGSGWAKVARTKHTVYLTYADPIETANVLRRETLFNLGCRMAQGDAIPNSIVPSIYTEFTDQLVERVKPSSGERDGDPMEYWATLNEQRATTERLLQDGTGACGAWARFFIDCLRAQGIDAELSRILPRAEGLTDALRAALSAKHGGTWSAGIEQHRLFIRTWNVADTFNPLPETGVKAQHNADPNSEFADHSVARYGGKIYDPSYGSVRPGGGPFLTLLEWEDASLQATGTRYINATRDNGTMESGKWIFKLNIPATEETYIGPQAWEE